MQQLDGTLLKQIYDILPPRGQDIFGAIIIAFGVFVMVQAWLNGRKAAAAPAPQVAQPRDVPQWLMMGPLHDMMQSVHEVAEQSRLDNEHARTQLAILRDIDKGITRFNNGQEYTHRILEEVLRGQEFRRQMLTQQRPERVGN